MNELQDKRIYIVEDDPTNMAVFAVTLRNSGAKVFQDPWNMNVLENIKKYLPVDLIVLDLMLRLDVSGYDIFDALQANEATASIPVVIVSAADPGIEIPKAKAKGLTGFIGKPIKPFLFPKQIAACIQGEKVWYAQSAHLEDL